jgi:F1F0 ATPase subunit 2
MLDIFLSLNGLDVISSLTLGFASGGVYFAGLWWTVRKLPHSTRPALWTIASLGLRTGLLLVVFYLVMQGRWERLLLCLLGFSTARVLVMHAIQPRS